MKMKCVLCKGRARIHCESDQASLCWDCDAKVHSANFLVARHSRNLLCRVCQSPMSWSAAGSKLEPIYSDCRKCAKKNGCDGRDGEEEEEVKKEEEEIAEIHVVPWSPPENSLSGGGETVLAGEAPVARKRVRLDSDHSVLEDLNICTAAEVASFAHSVSGRIATAPRKIRRTDGSEAEVRVARSPIDEAVRRFRRVEAESGDEIPEYRMMSGGVDLNLTLGLSSR